MQVYNPQEICKIKEEQNGGTQHSATLTPHFCTSESLTIYFSLKSSDAIYGHSLIERCHDDKYDNPIATTSSMKFANSILGRSMHPNVGCPVVASSRTLAMAKFSCTILLWSNTTSTV